MVSLVWVDPLTIVKDSVQEAIQFAVHCQMADRLVLLECFVRQPLKCLAVT